MGILWTICGAVSGVGKTHLARNLCELLPDAVYAKLGCSDAKPNKPGNYFRDENKLTAFADDGLGNHKHVIVECNSWAREGRGDVIIYLDSVPGQENVRDDAEALRANAHIRVSSGASASQWEDVLKDRLNDSALCRKICDLLLTQRQHLSSPKLNVRSKVWFVAEDERAFGSGLAALLENIDHLGTLTEAAKSAKMSYRHAWDLIKSAESHLGRKLIIPHSGGAGGGQTVLSRDGRRLLEIFNRVNEEVEAFADARFSAHFYGDSSNEQV